MSMQTVYGGSGWNPPGLRAKQAPHRETVYKSTLGGLPMPWKVRNLWKGARIVGKGRSRKFKTGIRKGGM